MSIKQMQDYGQDFSPDTQKTKRSVVKILAVGDPKEWQRKGNAMPAEDVVFLSFDEVTESTLAYYAPSIVYSPAVASAFDCIELALLLRNLGFSGAYCAVARDLPHPELIEREVAQMCPNVNFQMVVEH